MSNKPQHQLTGSEELKQHFEQNMLDGDKIQSGQMLSSGDVWEYLKDLQDMHTKHLARVRLEAQIEEFNLAYDSDSLELTYARERKNELAQLASMEKTEEGDKS